MKRNRKVEQKTRRKRYIELGLCMTCGKENNTEFNNCLECSKKMNERTSNWRKNNPIRNKEIHNKSYWKNHETILEHARWYARNLWLECIYNYSYGTMICNCCGEPIIYFLTIDHINGGGCKHRKKVGEGITFYHWLIDNGFPEGYQVLCYNCNCGRAKNGNICPHKQKTLNSTISTIS
jgi:hypothetical protein